MRILQLWSGPSRISLSRIKRNVIFPRRRYLNGFCFGGIPLPVCKKCGFRGYREFIYQYEDTFREKKSRPFADNTRRVLDTYQELLNKAYNLADEKKFKKIAGMLFQAERIFVCGVGSSGIAARETELRFMRIGLNINSLVDRDMIRMRAVFQNETSLVIGFSMKGQTEEVQYMLQEAKRRVPDASL